MKGRNRSKIPGLVALLALTIFLAATSPAATTITQFAQLYDRDAQYAGAINVVSTLCCIVTMPLFVFLYELL